jgi:hypothetical protein
MGDLLGRLVWGAKSGQYCIIGGGSLHLWSIDAFLVHSLLFPCSFTFKYVVCFLLDISYHVQNEQKLCLNAKNVKEMISENQVHADTEEEQITAHAA